MLTLALAFSILTRQDTAPAAATSADVYETPALAELVGRAAAVNRHLPESLASYGARVETELSIVRLEADGRETVLQLEQVASDLSWRADGGLLMQLVGYRSQMLGPSFSALSFFDVPWAVPTLYGERLDLVRSGGPTYAEDGTLLVRRVLHPLAEAREDVYRFTGGDTVLVLHLPGRTVPIVRMSVVPVRMPELPTLLFQGDIDLDVTRMHIVSMQGRLSTSHRSRSVLDAFARGVLFVRFDSGEYDEAYWLPREQRFEAQAISRLGEGRVLLRVVSRFLDVRPNDPSAARLAPSPDEFPGGLLAGGDDLGRLDGFGEWRLPMGELNARAAARDFDAYGPPGLAPDGRPRVSFGARHLSHLLRINRVEGIYTGGGLAFDFGDAAPGLGLRGHVGYAWRERAVRGGVEVQQGVGRWQYVARGERQLVHTHDFVYAFEPEPDVTPFLGGEDFNYLDRRAAGVLARRVGAESVAWRFEVARVADRAAGRDPAPAEPSEPGPPPPPGEVAGHVAAGDYWRGRAEVRRNPSAGGISLHPGLLLRAAYEAASGDFDWQRLEAGAALRRMVGPWTLSLSGDAGVVISREPPPQALFELGVTAEVPRFVDHTLTGDRAALARGTIMYTLPLLNAPLRVGAMWLPAPAPSPSVGLRLGWTDAAPETRERMELLGWRTSEGVRSTIDLRLRFFGGSVSVGAARPLHREGRWQFVWGLLGGA